MINIYSFNTLLFIPADSQLVLHIPQSHQWELAKLPLHHNYPDHHWRWLQNPKVGSRYPKNNESKNIILKNRCDIPIRRFLFYTMIITLGIDLLWCSFKNVLHKFKNLNLKKNIQNIINIYKNQYQDFSGRFWIERLKN